jgi:hypothetical protein
LGVGEISLGIISIYGMEIIWHLMEKSWCWYGGILQKSKTSKWNRDLENFHIWLSVIVVNSTRKG